MLREKREKDEQNKNKYLFWFTFLLLACIGAPINAATTGDEPGKVDVQDIVFSHIRDAYTWHITEWNGKEISIPLPVLVRSEERGWDMFLSSHLHHGNVHHNYYVAGEGEHAGKVVEKNSRGEEVKPLDLSLTKTQSACCSVAGYCFSSSSGQPAGIRSILTKHPADLPD